MKIIPIGHLVKTNPIQTQSNPIAERVKLMQSVYLQRIMKKNADMGYEKTKPKQTQFPQSQKRTQTLVQQRIMKMKPPTGPKKQTQSKPVLSAVEWANLKKNESKLLYCRVKLFLLLLPP